MVACRVTFQRFQKFQSPFLKNENSSGSKGSNPPAPHPIPNTQYQKKLNTIRSSGRIPFRDINTTKISRHLEICLTSTKHVSLNTFNHKRLVGIGAHS